MTDGNEKRTGCYSLVKTGFATACALIVTMGTIIGIIAGAIYWIDARIEDKLNSEEFIRKISSRIKPYIIFDENETILVDGGGMEYVDGIQITSTDTSEYPILTIVVTTKRYLPLEPVLTIVDSTHGAIEAKRGANLQFLYSLPISGYSGPEERPSVRLRLDIVI